jgi:predicted MFS family arabinose efflux permease
MVGLIDGPSTDWTALPTAALVLGTATFALFVRRQATDANPLLKPSLFQNRGFTAGLGVGLAFFAATSGLTYVISLFLQQALHVTALQASLALVPLSLGVIVSSGAGVALMTRLGRTLILVGLLVTLIGAGWILALVAHRGPALTPAALTPALFVVGLGMGACFGTIFNFALGGIAPDEAGSASGAVAAVQQLANAIGSAAVTTVYFRSAGPGTPAMPATLGVVLALVALCLPLTAWLPRRARAGGHP